MIIFLTGMSGSGKTSTGKKLAKSKSLNAKFIDIDKYIENNYTMNIENIFKYFGEKFFRYAEYKTIQFTIAECNKNKNDMYVVSLGAGALNQYYPSMPLIKENGILVYLNPSINTIIKNLTTSTQKRPLLPKNHKDLRQFLIQTLKVRSKYYQQADITVNCDFVNAIIKNLKF